MTAGPPGAAGESTPAYRLILFIAGSERNSLLALENLQRICRDRLKSPCDLMVVDVLEDMTLAAEHNILLTPTLLVLEPQPPVILIGNLNDGHKLCSALRIENNP